MKNIIFLLTIFLIITVTKYKRSSDKVFENRLYQMWCSSVSDDAAELAIKRQFSKQKLILV